MGDGDGDARDRGYTKAYRVSHGAASLDVYVQPTADLDDEVRGWHAETLELLTIDGWRIRTNE